MSHLANRKMMKLLLISLMFFMSILSASTQTKYAIKKYSLRDVQLISKALDFYLKNNELKIDEPVANIEEQDTNTLKIHFVSGVSDTTYDGSKLGNHFFTVTLTKLGDEWIPIKVTGMR